jgi:hypothetical protein
MSFIVRAVARAPPENASNIAQGSLEFLLINGFLGDFILARRYAVPQDCAETPWRNPMP